MTVTNANDVNAVLKFFLSEGRAPADAEKALAAAQRLADSACKRLLAGLDARRVAEQWPVDRYPLPSRDSDMARD